MNRKRSLILFALLLIQGCRFEGTILRDKDAGSAGSPSPVLDAGGAGTGGAGSGGAGSSAPDFDPDSGAPDFDPDAAIPVAGQGAAGDPAPVAGEGSAGAPMGGVGGNPTGGAGNPSIGGQGGESQAGSGGDPSAGQGGDDDPAPQGGSGAPPMELLPLELTAFAIDHQQGFSSIASGETVLGSVTYYNPNDQPFMVKQVVIAGRPPGGTHAGGPYRDLIPMVGPTTLPPFEGITFRARRTMRDTDPLGVWEFYPTWQGLDNRWHDGASLTMEVRGPRDDDQDGGI